MKKLKKIPALAKLLIGTAILVSIGYLVAENPLHLTTFTCQRITYIILCIIFIALMTIDLVTELFTMDRWPWKLFFSSGIPLFLAYITTALLMWGQSFHYYQINFWSCLVFWIILYVLIIDPIGTVSGDGWKKKTIFEHFVLVLSSAWTISSAYITLGTTILDYDEKTFNTLLTRRMQILPFIVVVIWVAGVVLFFLALIDFLEFTTFKTFGVFSTFLTAIVSVGFVIYLINNFTKNKSKPKTETALPKDGKN